MILPIVPIDPPLDMLNWTKLLLACCQLLTKNRLKMHN